MVGKKSSLSQLKEELRHQKVPKFSTTEFCQGRTMRWGIAWSFDETITFPRSRFESRKEKPPLQFFVPKGAANVLYNVHAIAGYLKDLFRSMKIHCYQGKMAKSYSSITLTAVENTWCHQRRLRRQQQRNKKVNESVGTGDGEASNQTDGKDRPQAQGKADTNDLTLNTENSSISRSHEIGKETETGEGGLSSSSNETKSDSKKRLLLTTGNADSNENNDRKRVKLDGSISHQDQPDVWKDSEATCLTPNNSGEASNVSHLSESGSRESIRVSPSKGSNCEATGSSKEAQGTSPTKDSMSKSENQDGESPKEYILKCVMRLKRADEQISLELEWLDGKSRELMYQVKTFLQNKLKVA